jgi:hypothetical protein
LINPHRIKQTALGGFPAFKGESKDVCKLESRVARKNTLDTDRIPRQ